MRPSSSMAMPPELPGAIRASVSNSELGPRSGLLITVEIRPLVTVIESPDPATAGNPSTVTSSPARTSAESPIGTVGNASPESSSLPSALA